MPVQEMEEESMNARRRLPNPQKTALLNLWEYRLLFTCHIIMWLIYFTQTWSCSNLGMSLSITGIFIALYATKSKVHDWKTSGNEDSRCRKCCGNWISSSYVGVGCGCLCSIFCLTLCFISFFLALFIYNFKQRPTDSNADSHLPMKNKNDTNTSLENCEMDPICYFFYVAPVSLLVLEILCYIGLVKATLINLFYVLKDITWFWCTIYVLYFFGTVSVFGCLAYISIFEYYPNVLSLEYLSIYLSMSGTLAFLFGLAFLVKCSRSNYFVYFYGAAMFPIVGFLLTGLVGYHYNNVGVLDKSTTCNNYVKQIESILNGDDEVSSMTFGPDWAFWIILGVIGCFHALVFYMTCNENEKDEVSQNMVFIKFVLIWPIYIVGSVVVIALLIAAPFILCLNCICPKSCTTYKRTYGDVRWDRSRLIRTIHLTPETFDPISCIRLN